MRVIENVRYGNEKDNFLDIYYPDSEEFDVLVWIHGGGLLETRGNFKKDIPLIGDLVQAGYAVVSVEYRRYPEAVFPNFITDCARAVKYVMDSVAKEDGAKRVFLSGSSAGAYITMMLAMDKKYLEEAGVDRDEVAGFISNSAQMTSHFNVLKERGLDSRLERIDDAAPMYYLSENSFTGNLLIIYYTDDMPCRPEENQLFFKSIKRFCPDQHIEIVELPGVHCQGKNVRNEKGTFDFADALFEFISKIS